MVCMSPHLVRKVRRRDTSVPYYIYIDNHGFIYVADFLNNRIQCF